MHISGAECLTLVSCQSDSAVIKGLLADLQKLLEQRVSLGEVLLLDQGYRLVETQTRRKQKFSVLVGCVLVLPFWKLEVVPPVHLVADLDVAGVISPESIRTISKCYPPVETTLPSFPTTLIEIMLTLLVSIGFPFEKSLLPSLSGAGCSST